LRAVLPNPKTLTLPGANSCSLASSPPPTHGVAAADVNTDAAANSVSPMQHAVLLLWLLLLLVSVLYGLYPLSKLPADARTTAIEPGELQQLQQGENTHRTDARINSS